MAGLAMALAHSRGLFEYDERVSTYWPEFAQQGKEAITVRQLLSHQAGLFALNERPDTEPRRGPRPARGSYSRGRNLPGSREPARPTTASPSGSTRASCSAGLIPGIGVWGRFFQEEIADPLGLDFYIRLPEEIPNARLAPLERPRNMLAMFFTMPLPLVLAAMNPRSRFRRCLEGSELPEEEREHVYARNLEVPAGGGVGTARAMARAYGVFATGGGELGLHKETLRHLMAPAVPPVHGFRDGCIKVEVRFSLGFMKPDAENPFGHPTSFGAPGTGGSFGFADPHAGIGYAYIPNQMGVHLEDPREAALRRAMYRSIGEPDPYHA